jgi:hypothetical protein
MNFIHRDDGNDVEQDVNVMLGDVICGKTTLTKHGWR